MYTLTLNDGTVYGADFAAALGDTFTAMIVTDETLLEVASKFSDKASTQKMAFKYGEMSAEHEGYTRLILVNGTTPGKYILSLTKE